jgi:hypothetical protein
MAILNVYLKSFVKPYNDFNKALDHCKQRLHTYFMSCIAHPNNTIFKSVQVATNAHSQSVGEMDLLVYVIANHANRLIRDRFVQDTAGGATTHYSDGAYCEVYAKRAMDEGEILFGLFANNQVQGAALANLAFHELAHNKWRGLPEDLRKKYNVANPNENIHQVGEGLMKGWIDEGKIAEGIITRKNVEVMAALIQYPVKQRTNVPVYSNRW